MNRTIIIASSLLAIMTTSAFAGSIDYRQEKQVERIQEGRRSGELTVFEAARLRAEQARISRLEREAKADGHVSRSEARTITQAQNAAGRHIYQESHDSQRSWFRKWF